jgi:hypothetical protein
MKDPTKTSISVSIDLNDPFEKSLYDHVMSKGTRKKSGYIKRLIHADKIGVVIQEVTTTTHHIEENENKEAMLGFF